MAKLTKPQSREIIDDFADQIKIAKISGPKPTKAVINFRNEQKNGVERDVYLVPAGLLRYRKDNGRISSDVLHYERHFGILDETTAEAQNKLREFLEAKDKPKTEELIQSIKHDGQRDPAIITCDGFLINGNRRKMAFEKLYKSSLDECYLRMKVVILPGKTDEGGVPSLLEIEQIENRYQLQSDGNHSAVFPTDLPAWFIKLFTKKGDIVLDPFVGSGTTALASKRLGRRYIGIELNKKFYNLAKNNLRNFRAK